MHVGPLRNLLAQHWLQRDRGHPRESLHHSQRTPTCLKARLPCHGNGPRTAGRVTLTSLLSRRFWMSQRSLHRCCMLRACHCQWRHVGTMRFGTLKGDASDMPMHVGLTALVQLVHGASFRRTVHATSDADEPCRRLVWEHISRIIGATGAHVSTISFTRLESAAFDNFFAAAGTHAGTMSFDNSIAYFADGHLPHHWCHRHPCRNLAGAWHGLQATVRVFADADVDCGWSDTCVVHYGASSVLSLGDRVYADTALWLTWPPWSSRWLQRLAADAGHIFHLVM